MTALDTAAADVIRAEMIGVRTCASHGITAHAHAPVLALCRKLIAAGFDPAQPLHAYRGDTLCLVIKSIGAGAGLRVNEDGARFVAYDPILSGDVGSRIAPAGVAATPMAAGTQNRTGEPLAEGAA